MRTTKKEFVAQIQEHIANRLSEDETTVLSEQLQNVMDDFKDWYNPYEKKLTPNRHDALKHWLWGLPSSLSLEYQHYNISKILKKWFNECGEEYKEIGDGRKEADFYMNLVIREFNKMYNKHCKQTN
jgi:hypothetical protein